MLESMNTSSLEYEKLSEEEMNRRGILGRLVGPIADTVNATRNNRKYSDELWEAVFNNPIMKEKFDRGGVFGECGHPTDRTEVDMEKIALCMPKPPKKDRTGKLQAVFDILATPCGKILKTLCDYGYKIGISSRGSGDTYIDNDGNESVDPKTYDCECFDAVLIPAVKAATLKLVTESIDNKISFKRALSESLKSAKDGDRKIMESTLNNLGIDYQEKPDILSIVSNQFGTTNEPYYGATFILPNGEFLNIQSYKHHSDVEKWLIDNGYSNNEFNVSTGSKSLTDLGCIRCDSVKYYIALNDIQPTREQYNSLLIWMDSLSSTTKVVEVITPDNQSIVYNFNEIIPDYIINRIRRYYSSGVLYEKLNQKHQHNFIYKREPIGEALSEPINEDIKINTPVNPTSSGSNNTVTDDSIDLDNIDDKEDEENNSSSEDKDIVNQNDMEAKNSGSDVVEDLQEALRKNRELEKQILELQEKLSVCYAKEAKSDEAIQKYRSSIKSLSESLKKATSINQKASILENQLDEKNKEIEQKQKLIEDLESKNKNSIIRKRQEVSSLNESLADKDKEIENLTKRVRALNEDLSSIKGESEKEINNLKEQLGEAKKDALITAKNYSNKIAKSNEIVEQYKKTAQKAVNKYIDLQASFLGITANEIKNRLPKSYSFNDIDSICENLQEYRVNISKLPFAVDSLNEDFDSSKIRMQAETSEKPLLDTYSSDDVVDKSLLNLANDLMNK